MPHRQFSEYQARLVHVGLPLAREVNQSYHRIFPIASLRTGREQHFPDSSNHSPYLMKLFNSSSPEGNFGECATSTHTYHTATQHATPHQHTQHGDRERRQRKRERREDEREETRRDETRRDETRQDKTRQDKTRQDKTRQDKTRQDKTRQDKTGRDRTRQDKTRRDRTSAYTVRTDIYGHLSVINY